MMDEAGVLVSPLANRPKGNSELNQTSLGAPPYRLDHRSQISGCDAENKDEKTIYTQLLEVVSKLGVLIDKTRPINTGVSQEEQGSGSEEWAKEIHTTLSSSRINIRVWLDDTSNIVSSLPDAFEHLASCNAELEQTLQKIVQGMHQRLASVDEMVVSDARGPSITAGHQSCDVVQPCNDFRGLVNRLQNLKQQVQRDLRSIRPDGSRQGEAIIDYPPSILCLDGGGVRSFVSLIILQRLMTYVHAPWEGLENQPNAASTSPPKPCDIFDFIFGSSSGGLLAIMLGRLEMTIEQCFEKFSAYADEIFCHRRRFPFFPLSKYSDKRLIRAIRHIVGDFDPSPDSKKWRGTIFKDTSGQCRTGVLAYIAATGNPTGLGLSYTPYMIRSYDCEPEIAESEEESGRFPALNPGPASSFQIWEAARATTAAPRYFTPLKHKDQEFYDGGITSNNPSLQTLGEMQALMPHTPINCIVSIGTGDMPPLAAVSQDIVGLITMALTETQNTERLAFAIANSLEIPYFRFNPKLQRRFAMDEWIRQGSPPNATNMTLYDLRVSVEEFLDKGEVITELRKCAEILAYRTTSVSKHILDWLTAVDYVPVHSDLVNYRAAGTGQWLLDSKEFRQWLRAGSETLFCSGGPKVGKTMLTSIVIDELRAHSGSYDTAIAYVYCNWHWRRRQRAEDILASLLRQLAQGRPSLSKSVKLLYEQHTKQRTRPSLSEISRVLQSVVVLYSRVFIVIDAIDECREADRIKLLSEIFGIQKEFRVAFFATSRFIVPELVKQSDNTTLLEIRAHEEDVQRYVDSQMSRLPSFVDSDEDLQQDIKTTIANTADGIFSLAGISLLSLIGCKSLKVLQKNLAEIRTNPGYYDSMYRVVLSRIETQLSNQRALAIQVLSWITCAKRPLNVTELRHALAVEVGEPQLDPKNLSQIEDMLAVCGGLVTVDKESGIVRFFHYTAQEYFKRMREEEDWFPNAEAEIATICAVYLSFDVFKSGLCRTDEEFEERLSGNAFYDYAANNWGHHARIASTSCQAVMDFLECGTKVEASSQAMMAHKRASCETGYSQRTPRRMTGLHLAAYFGVEIAIKTLLEKSYDPDATDSHGQTPLSWAAAGGHEAIVQPLLNVAVDADCRDVSGRTPDGNTDVVEPLQDSSPNPV